MGDLFMRLTFLADAGPVAGKTPGCANKVNFRAVTEFTSIELTGAVPFFHRRVVFYAKTPRCVPAFERGEESWLRYRVSGYGSKFFEKWVDAFFPSGTPGSSVYDAPLRKDILNVLEDSKKIHYGKDAGGVFNERWRNRIDRTVTFDADHAGALEIGYGQERGGTVDFSETSGVPYIMDIYRVGVPGSEGFPLLDAGDGNVTVNKTPNMVSLTEATVRHTSTLALYWKNPQIKSVGSRRSTDIQAPVPSLSAERPVKAERAESSKMKRELSDEDMDMDLIPDAGEDEIGRRREGSEPVVLPDRRKKGTVLR